MFQPVVPVGGIAGWRFLEATEDTQRAAFDRSPLLDRDIAYFEENIRNVTSAEELVGDTTLLRVALGAFGLEDDLFKRAFIRQILEGGTEDPQSLANRFVDPRYRDFSESFGFGNFFGARTVLPGFVAEITDAYRARSFEVAVGTVNQDMRLALNLKREIGDLAAAPDAETTSWFRILGNAPLRQVFQAAFNLPAEFAGLDIDRQREELQDRNASLFGSKSVAAFLDPGNVDQLIDRFLASSQINAGPTAGTPGYAALSLLQSSNVGSVGLANLILSGVR